MRNSIILSVFVAVVAIFFFLPGFAIQAGTDSKSGTLDASDPSIFDNTFLPTTFYFETYPFTVTQTGEYTVMVNAPSSPPQMYVVVNLTATDIFPPLFGANNWFHFTGSGTLTAGVTYYLHPYTNEAAPNIAYDVSISGPSEIIWGSGAADETSAGSPTLDGRINRYDFAAPVAAYPVTFADGMGLHIYAIDDAGLGDIILEVTPAMIAAVPAESAVNTLVASTNDGTVAVYRLDTGEFQVNVGGYVFAFWHIDSTAYYYHP